MIDVSMIEVPIHRVQSGSVLARQDVLAVEEPLEIRLGYAFKETRRTKPVSVTMRTPGHDAELAAGFLFTEGIVRERRDIVELHPAGPPQGRWANEWQVELADDVDVDLARLERHFYTSSSCGVCGKTTLEAVAVQGASVLARSLAVRAEVLPLLPEKLRAAQAVFTHTGGLHAAALFTAEGELMAVREDVGRHNAMDKLLGSAFLAGQVPLTESIVLVSGRASYELLQKALMAGVPVLAAVGAPSSLAVELAQRFQMTLVGFLRPDYYNIYAGAERIEEAR